MTPVVLGFLFLAERDRFARAYPDSVVRIATLEIDDGYCPSGEGCAWRDVAQAAWHERKATVIFAHRALALPRANIVAILRHEFGHIVDPTPNAQGAEARADRIAASVGGVPIHYDRRDLQTVGPGRKRRPRHLHQ